MRAMSRKKVMSSDGEVSTVRDGGSMMWDLYGTDVSIVRVSVEVEEMERWWVVRGRRRGERVVVDLVRWWRSAIVAAMREKVEREI